MILDVQKVFLGDSISIDTKIDLKLLSEDSDFTPITLKGEISNKAGIVYFNYNVCFSLQLQCDRCLQQFNKDYDLNFSQILVNFDTENDEYIQLEDYKLNIEEVILTDILLTLPSKILCSNDCKGLCSKCGKNLNLGVCGCIEKKIDPRLQVLSQL
ncbi:MAG: DUF177 domain-containing protein [Oscillospiraceae bacterium]